MNTRSKTAFGKYRGTSRGSFVQKAFGFPPHFPSRQSTVEASTEQPRRHMRRWLFAVHETEGEWSRCSGGHLSLSPMLH